MDKYNNKLQQFRSITGDMVCTYVKKNKDYGDSFSEMTKRWGWRYPLIHLEEKLARVKSILLDQGGKPSVTGEGAEDSLLDLANYAIMTLLELRAGGGTELAGESATEQTAKRVYLCGKITGDPDAREKFSAAAARLQKYGYVPVNPFDNGLSEDDPWEEHMERDLELLRTCRYIHKIPGWRKSKGAQIESACARSWGIKGLLLPKCNGASWMDGED